MKIIITIVAILIALVGLVWFGQGIGLIHGSVMTDDRKWAVIGGIMILLGIAIIWFFGRSR